MAEEPSEPVRPLAPGETLLLPDVGRGPILHRVVAVEVQMPELGVRDEDAVDEQRRPDARAERQQDHDAVTTGGRPELDLGEAGCIGVVDHPERSTGRVGEESLGVGADPRSIDVGGTQHRAVAHDGRERAADGSLVLEVIRHLGDDIRDRVGSGGARGEDLVTVGEQTAGRRVDEIPLDAGTADVDAEDARRRTHTRRG